jgi:multidrug efflux pump subunit AcrB
MQDRIEKLIGTVLLAACAVLVVISMFAGPLGNTVVSLGASISAAIIAFAFIVFVMLEHKKF